ncbi:Tetrapyrrole (Corrin/Porphyrin) Methylase [Phytophthora cinnamomi]|uniref:Tetrapyrrole (Corrin/Porphyrin) Methylase n=1 Tax=Phytophthora cinnamomi TaxID=4785 RepID=UPI00355A3ECB|nr:Tetrapyrrole (Corrin/Porphyrin) Methylase [Phytophthora cinnamomi]
MKRRPLRAAGGFGLYALCICLSTIALQALTSPSPSPSPSSFLDVHSLLWAQPAPLSAADLRLRNLSVHRVRYVDDAAAAAVEEQESEKQQVGVRQALTDLLTARPRASEVSSVVATWEDHPLAAHARAKEARLEEVEQEQEQEEEQEEQAAAAEATAESYAYEVQIWVTGWGLDALWNPANRRVVTRDPFLVLADLPRAHEMGFRVRMKARQTRRSLLGFLLPAGFFSTETDGPWSDAATLSPTRDDELEAIVTSLASNKPLLLLLAVCIGSGCLVVAQLYFRRRLAVARQRKLLKMQSNRRSSSSEKDFAAKDASETTDSSSEDGGRSVQELEHEIRDLRQELADSEDEVRQLMLFSGYGIETLAPHDLEQLERELKHTLRRIHHLKKHGAAAPELASSETDPRVDEQRERRRHKQRDALPMSPIYEHRSF